MEGVRLKIPDLQFLFAMWENVIFSLELIPALA